MQNQPMPIGRFYIKIDFHQFQAGITQRNGEIILSSLLQQALSKGIFQNQYFPTAQIEVLGYKHPLAG
ncbi:hypothetical protein KZ793_11575 [Photorhabdus sp. UCH-936]|nr:hypothetical protein [Photorhabdus antumapuensis]MCA6221166.1 hypothetical protein [Photorhabdus antumapuensis]